MTTGVYVPPLTADFEMRVSHARQACLDLYLFSPSPEAAMLLVMLERTLEAKQRTQASEDAKHDAAFQRLKDETHRRYGGA